MRVSQDSSRQRVLVARLDSMGDVLLSGPAVRAVAAHADVTVLTSTRGAAAAHLLPGANEVMEWDCPWITSPPPPVGDAEPQVLVREFAHRRFDAAVILTSDHQSPLPLALLAKMAGIPHVTGASHDHAGTLLDTRLRPESAFDADLPEPERALAIAHAAGFDLPDGDDGRLHVDADLSPHPIAPTEAYVVVHPGADAPAREWGAVRHRQAVAALTARGWRVVVTGAASEAALTAHVAGDDAVDAGGRLSLAELARVLAHASALVVGNTGPAHLAAAVETPVVSLFSPVVPASRWQPYAVPRVVLGDQHAACAGTRWRECALPDHPCLASVTPRDVVGAVGAIAPARSKQGSAA